MGFRWISADLMTHLSDAICLRGEFTLARRSSQADTPSGRPVSVARTARYDKEGRLTLPREVADAVTWVREAMETQDCLVVCGAAGGVQVDAMDGELAKQQAGLWGHLQRNPPDSSESDSEWVAVARFFSAAVAKLEIGQHRRLSIPANAAEMLMLPRTRGTSVVVWGCGSILEVWPVDQWASHQRETARQRNALWQVATRELDTRAD